MNDTTEPESASTNNDVPPGERPDDRAESGRFELALYLAAAIIYIAVGFVRQEIFAWWIYGAAWFVAVIWFVPPILHRLMKRVRPDTKPGEDST